MPYGPGRMYPVGQPLNRNSVEMEEMAFREQMRNVQHTAQDHQQHNGYGPSLAHGSQRGPSPTYDMRHPYVSTPSGHTPAQSTDTSVRSDSQHRSQSSGSTASVYSTNRLSWFGLGPNGPRASPNPLDRVNSVRMRNSYQYPAVQSATPVGGMVERKASIGGEHWMDQGGHHTAQSASMNAGRGGGAATDDHLALLDDDYDWERALKRKKFLKIAMWVFIVCAVVAGIGAGIGVSAGKKKHDVSALTAGTSESKKSVGASSTDTLVRITDSGERERTVTPTSTTESDAGRSTTPIDSETTPSTPKETPSSTLPVDKPSSTTPPPPSTTQAALPTSSQTPASTTTPPQAQTSTTPAPQTPQSSTTEQAKPTSPQAPPQTTTPANAASTTKGGGMTPPASDTAPPSKPNAGSDASSARLGGIPGPAARLRRRYGH